VRLLEVLDRAGVKAGAREVVFRGADSGKLDASSEPVRFERSLSMDDARGSEALPIQQATRLGSLFPVGMPWRRQSGSPRSM
jgi:DMSO/TMAO reductase YedYZ molybdopterin-dependent catalytic subunit